MSSSSTAAAYIAVNYTLHPPPSVSAPQSLEASKIHEFPIPNSSDHDNTAQVTTTTTTTTTGQKAFYENLRIALATAKETLGQELTAWRDVIGNAENGSDAKKADTRKSAKQEADDGASEEEEEEEDEEGA